jgi:hypothetical protein
VAVSAAGAAQNPAGATCGLSPQRKNRAVEFFARERQRPHRRLAIERHLPIGFAANDLS